MRRRIIQCFLIDKFVHSFDDKEAEIRLDCVKHAKYFLVFHPESSLDVLG